MLLTYSTYFSYAIFLTDYKKILKIAGGVKELTVPLLSDPNCSMPENDVQCVIPVKCCISFKTMLYPNFLMVWYADIIIFSGFMAMCMYIYKIISRPISHVWLSSPHDEHLSPSPISVKLCSDHYIFQFLFRNIIYITRATQSVAYPLA